MWRCPLCYSKITPLLDASSWKCENKHSFDRAKQGYYHLLPVQQKRSKSPGDDKQMVAARHGFLSVGHYAPLASKMASLLSEYFDESSNSSGADRRFYDAGCGTGYYLNQLCEHFSSANGAGHDISKFAIASAAKHYKSQQFVVASSINIPVQSCSQDLIIQVFSPSCAAEYARILRPHGLVITVEPGPDHLVEIKAEIYDNIKSHPAQYQSLAGFSEVEQQRVSFECALNESSNRHDLLLMTPYYWSASEQQKLNIIEKCATVTADFIVRILRKQDAAVEKEDNQASPDILATDVKLDEK